MKYYLFNMDDYDISFMGMNIVEISGKIYLVNKANNYHFYIGDNMSWQQLESAKEIKKLDDKLLNVLMSKNADYSSANIGLFGSHGVLVRLWDKFSRLLNLYGIPVPNYAKILDNGERACLNIDGLTETQKQQLSEIFAQMQKDVMIDFTAIKPKSPNNESRQDTIEDFINYGKILHLVDNNKWGR